MREPDGGKDKRLGWRDIVTKELFDEEKQELLHLSEISLILNEYNDIFSDFDPRPYSQRSLSDDFLLEAKKAAKVKQTGEVELMFLVPENARKQGTEAIIKKRLHDYFRKHHELLRVEKVQAQANGLKLTLLGMFFLLVATFMRLDEMRNPASVNNVEVLLSTILEPAGWFTAWTGLERIFLSSAEKKDELEFFEKMARAKISFSAY